MIILAVSEKEGYTSDHWRLMFEPRKNISISYGTFAAYTGGPQELNVATIRAFHFFSKPRGSGKLDSRVVVSAIKANAFEAAINRLGARATTMQHSES